VKRLYLDCPSETMRRTRVRIMLQVGTGKPTRLGTVWFSNTRLNENVDFQLNANAIKAACDSINVDNAFDLIAMISQAIGSTLFTGDLGTGTMFDADGEYTVLHA
jgi:hypothetical protein